MELSPIGLYPIVDAARLRQLPLAPAEVARVIADLPIRMVQLRHKGSAGDYYRFAASWMAAFRQHAPAVAVVINDRLDLALALGADGVHVGQEDLPVWACRCWWPKERLLGLSTHTLEEIDQAYSEIKEEMTSPPRQDDANVQVDYVGFGPVFDTTTKTDAHPTQGLAALAMACQRSRVPVVAIGGIDLARLSEVRTAGAHGAALVSGWMQPDWADRLGLAVRQWSEG